MEQCRRAGGFARRSGVMGFQCMHLKSMSFCPITLTLTLEEEVLTDMVKKRWISKNTKKVCLAQKQVAESEGCPLSEEIRLENGESKLYVSVKDTGTSYYSWLGRVVVYFDNRRNTWHCACTKQKNTCPHKCNYFCFLPPCSLFFLPTLM